MRSTFQRSDAVVVASEDATRVRPGGGSIIAVALLVASTVWVAELGASRWMLALPVVAVAPRRVAAAISVAICALALPAAPFGGLELASIGTAMVLFTGPSTRATNAPVVAAAAAWATYLCVPDVEHILIVAIISTVVAGMSTTTSVGFPVEALLLAVVLAGAIGAAGRPEAFATVALLVLSTSLVTAGPVSGLVYGLVAVVLARSIGLTDVAPVAAVAALCAATVGVLAVVRQSGLRSAARG